jgi:hypothetical protein
MTTTPPVRSDLAELALLMTEARRRADANPESSCWEELEGILAEQAQVEQVAPVKPSSWRQAPKKPEFPPPRLICEGFLPGNRRGEQAVELIGVW